MQALHFRNYRGPEDLPAMAACANASFAADGTDIVRTAEDMARDYATFIVCVPTRDVWLALAGEEVAGYVRCWHWRQADGLHLYAQVGFVAPHWRRRGVGRALLEWLQAHHRTLAAGQADATAHAHHSFVRENEFATAALLKADGYHVERHFCTMVRPTLRDIVDFPLPEGVEVRPVEPAHYRAIWDSHVRAFRTHWGFSPPTEADFAWWLRSPVFQPHLWQVAWDVEANDVVGQVRTYIDAADNAAHGRKRGATEFISVSEGWRRRGLARALIARSLRAQEAAGMQESALGVDAASQDGANRVYADCGFAVTQRNAIYRKAMALG